MTADQRRAINRRNARKSTGPNTPEGKERIRQNALKHGMRATDLALPHEDADTLQEEFNGWIDQYQPVGPAEFTLVEEIAVARLRLRRCSHRETAVVAGQVRSAQQVWINTQEDRLAPLQALLATDPATAVRQLKRFGEGRRWLLERWRCLGYWYLGNGWCGTPALIDEAVRLLGAQPERLKNGPLLAYKFRLYNTIGAEFDDPTYLHQLLSDAVIHPEYAAAYGHTVPDREFCRAEVRVLVAAQITMLELDEEEFAEDERADLAGAAARASLPADCGDTRLALRYESMARAALHKALKALEHLQNERYAVEAEADDAPDVIALADSPPEPLPLVAPNEAEPPSESPSSADSQPGCDSSTESNPDAPKAEPASAGGCGTGCGGGCPMARLCGRGAVASTLPIVTIEGTDSPPA